MSILHFGEHHKNALQSQLLEFTEKLGSKAGILEYLRIFPDLQNHILQGFSIDHKLLLSGSIPNLPSDFQGIEESLIYRSSHPDDHRGYIGMLPTLFSGHYAEENVRSAYDISSHELNMAKVYNALGFYQSYGRALPGPGNISLLSNDHYNLRGYPLSDPRKSHESREDLPKEYTEFVDEGENGYHINYYKLYMNLLEKVKNGNDTTDYSDMALSITHYQGWSYREMIKRVQENIRQTIGYKEETGLRGIEKTGIYIQPEVLPNGGTMGGIYESPHKKGVYIITFRTPTMESEKERSSLNGLYSFSDVPTSIIYDSESGEIKEIEGDSHRRCGFIPKIIELYRKVKEKNIFGEDYSFHMEFGFNGNKPLIYQVRQFSPYQKTSFKVDSLDSNYLVRGLTDEVGENVTIVLLGGYSHSGKDGKPIQQTANIGINFGKEESKDGIPLRQRRLVTLTGYGRLNDDHGVTKLLYETGGIAVAGTIPGPFPNRHYNKTQTYIGTIFSDGMNIAMEGIEEIDN